MGSPGGSRLAEELSPENLTGIWHGTYSYPGATAAVPFTLSLLDSNGTLTGTTYEVGTVPPARGLPLYGAIVGSRSGRLAEFRKTYHQEFAATGYNATISYEGAVNDAATEIAGDWRIPNAWAGNFRMIRKAIANEP